MAITRFSGPVDSENGFSINGTEVIDSNGQIAVPTNTKAVAIDGVSYGTTYTAVVFVTPALLDGNANTILTVPGGVLVENVRLICSEAAGTAATIDVGSDDSNWGFLNNDPNCFVEAFDVNTAPNSVNMIALDEANQAAAAQSGNLAQGESSIIVTASTDISGTDVSVVAAITLTQTNNSIFGA